MGLVLCSRLPARGAETIDHLNTVATRNPVRHSRRGVAVAGRALPLQRSLENAHRSSCTGIQGQHLLVPASPVKRLRALSVPTGQSSRTPTRTVWPVARCERRKQELVYGLAWSFNNPTSRSLIPNPVWRYNLDGRASAGQPSVVRRAVLDCGPSTTIVHSRSRRRVAWTVAIGETIQHRDNSQVVLYDTDWLTNGEWRLNGLASAQWPDPALLPGSNLGFRHELRPLTFC